MPKADIGPRIGIDGEADFRKQLKLITQQSKELASEMKAVTSAFDKNDSSQNKLASQSAVLSKQIELQKNKISLLDQAYGKANSELERLAEEVQKATQTYGKNSDEAIKAQNAYMRQAESVSKLKSDINNATAALNKMEQQLNDVNSEMKDKSAYDRLTDAIEDQEKELKDLKKAYQNAVLEFGDASDEAKDLGNQIEKTSTELKQSKTAMKKAADAADELDKSMDDASESSNGLTGSLSGFKDVFTGNLIADAAKAAVSAMKDLYEASIEYRTIMASLEISSANAGYSAAETEQSYRKLIGVLGDTQTAATTLSNLQAIGLEQNDLNNLIYGAVGAWATYGDSIPIDSLSESINETIKMKKVTGTFADVLNWAKGEEDSFNAELANCKDKTEAANLVLKKLAKEGLVDAGRKWEDENQDLVDYNRASDDLQAQLAELGKVAGPVLADLVEGLTEIATLIAYIAPYAKMVLDAAPLSIDKISDSFSDLIAQKAGFNSETMDQLELMIAEGESFDVVIEKLTEKQKAEEEENKILQESILFEQERGAQIEATTQRSIEVIGEELQAYNNLSTEQQQLAVEVTTAIQGMEQNVKSALESQMNMFEAFNGGVQLSTDEMLNNMRSQVAGVEQWEQNIAALSSRAINDDLLQHLIELGPQGAGYVQTFVNMSDAELSEAGSLWSQSLDIKNMTNEWGQTLLETGAESIASGMDGITSLMEDSGADTALGLARGIERAASEVNDAGDKVGEDLLKTVNSSLGVASPSKKTMRSGAYVDEGLIKGIQSKQYLVKIASKILADSVTNIIDAQLQQSTFYSIGLNIDNGLVSGINDGMSSVINAAANMAALAAQAARNTLQIHSPSKVFEEIGEFTGEGFVVGFTGLDIAHEIGQSMSTMIRNAESLMTVQNQYAPIENAIRSIPAGNTDIQIVVNAAEGQDAEEIANAVMYRMQHEVNQRKAVWG